MSQPFHEQEILTPELDPIVELNDFRSRVLAGEELSSQEYAKVIESLRRSRTAIPVVKGKKKVTAASESEAAKAIDDLLGF